MFIPVSVEQKSDPAGRAVLFCPVCRDLRAATAVRTRYVLSGLMVIPLWKWDERLDLHCPACEHQWRRDQDYPCFDCEDDDVNPVDLLERADDDLVTRLSERCDLERRLEQRTLRHDERQLLLAEPFQELDHLSDEAAGGQMPTLAGIAIIGLVLGIPATIAILLMVPDALAKLTAVLICIGLAGLLILDLTFLEPRRRGRGVYGALARSLAPLAPTDPELQEVMIALRAQNCTLARRARLSSLRRELDHIASSPQSASR